MSSEGRSWFHFLQDMLGAIDRIWEKTTDRTFEEFAQSRDSIVIVAWNVHVLGEATTHIPQYVVEAHPEIPWAEMRTMRNRLVHGYADLNPMIIWDTAVADLPPLHDLLQKLALGAEAGGQQETP